MTADLTEIEVPTTPAAVAALAPGQPVLLTGRIRCSAGIPAYQRLIDIARGAEAAHRAPADIEGGALLHLGSSVRSAGDGWAIDYVNLTTSARFNHLMPEVLRRLGRACSGARAGSTMPAPARSGRSAVPTCPSSGVPRTR